MSDFEKELEENITLLNDYRFPQRPWGLKEEEMSDLEKKGLKAMELLYSTRKKLRDVLFKAIATRLKEVRHPEGKILDQRLTGQLVRIRPCAKEYQDKTYVGIYLGDMATGTSVSIKDDVIGCDFSGSNPAIYVPAIKKVIFGYESWWGEITDEKDVTNITDEAIDQTWYVKILREMIGTEKEEKEEENKQEMDVRRKL
jgi:hypothetical protein